MSDPTWADRLLLWKKRYLSMLDENQRAIVKRVGIFCEVKDLGPNLAGQHRSDSTLHYIQISKFLDEEDALETFGHEYAHLCDWILNKQHEHGISWKRLMCQLGLPPREKCEIQIDENK